MHSRQSLAGDFRALGVSPGDIVMLHASVRAVGEVAGGPDQIHLALGDAVGDTGTLLMYAGCPQYVDEVGRGNLTPKQEAEVIAKLPAFDANTARSARDHGVLVEFFRTFPGAVVSQHPTRFVARGRHADELVAGQPWDFAFGHRSPLDRFFSLGGKILLLGTDHDTVTFLHYAEHVVDFPGKRIVRFKVPVIENGERVFRDMSEVNSSGDGAHPNWPDRFFARIVDRFIDVSGNRGGVVGNAASHILPAPALFDFAAAAMIAQAVDPDAVNRL